MVARITRLLLLVQALAALGLTLLATWLGGTGSLWESILFALLAVLAVRMAITANNFMLASRHRSKLPEQCRLNGIAFLRLFLGEFRATMISSSWTMPFCGFSRRPAADTKGPPVLLIHGYGCNSGYWHSMSKALAGAGITHHAVDMVPITAGIDDYLAQVHAAVEALCRESGRPRIVLLCHSMGGLVARAYLRKYGSARIAHVITLGTPHRGTALARFGVGANTRQMRWTATDQEGLASEWLRRLADDENEHSRRLFTSIYSHHDNIISPQTSSHLEGAGNIALHAIGHVALAMNAQVQAIVVRELLAMPATP